MFKKNKIQYINILKDSKHIKLDSSIFVNQKLQKNENTSFLLKDDNTPSTDLFTKIDIMEKNIPKTYISTFTLNSYQKIEKKDNIDLKLYSTISLDDNYCIIIPKNDIEDEKEFFHDHIDYIFSPFCLLYDQTAAKASKNSLNVLIKENKLFMFIFDHNKQISQSIIKEITPFNSIKESKFYNDEISEQRLYEEVYFLEVQQSLSDFTQKYYQEFSDTQFIEQINIYYTINRINDEQLDQLHETLMAKVNYYSISLEENIKKLSQKTTAKNFSFTLARSKKEPSNIILWGSLAAASVVLAAGVIYFKTIETSSQKEPVKNIEKKKETVEKIKEVKKEPKKISLPDHKLINSNLLAEIRTLFKIVPDDAILQEIKLDSSNSTIVCNFIANSTSPNDMKFKLEKIYKTSKIILSHQNEAVLSSIITNENKLQKTDISILNTYSPLKYVSLEQFKMYIKSLLPKDSSIEYIKTNQNDFTSYEYDVSINITTPVQFYDIIEKLSNDQIPININYPLEFAKLHDNLNVKFKLQYHQKNKL